MAPAVTPSRMAMGSDRAWRVLVGAVSHSLAHRRILVLTLLLLDVSAASGQIPVPRTVITGVVSDAVSGVPLGGATVSLESTGVLTTTGPTGRFRLENAPAGPQVLRVIRIGFASLRRPITVPVSGTLTVDVALAKSALNLPNLTVTADPASRARGELGTASVIESEAIKNQTAASLAGILELVPGVTLQPPGLGGVQQFALRAVPISTGGGAIGVNATGPSASSLASFGTQIVLDGVPISNNVNLQSLGARGELSFASAAGGGIDLRRIPAATIERVEVIRGIPSARFGDLTQGLVLVDTRAGVVAPELRVRLDARTVEATMAGGADLFRHQTGTANLNLARTRLAPGFRDDIGSRISAQVAHRLTGTRLVLDSRLDFFQILEDEPESPVFPGAMAQSRDNGFRASERLRWQLGRESRLEWTAAFEWDRQRSFSQSPKLRGAAPFTSRLTEGRQDGKFVGGLYLARVDVNGDPRQLYSRLELIGPGDAGGFRHDWRAGAELRRESNGGPGYQFDIEFPPQVDFNGVQGYARPRRYDQVLPLVTSALYLDDRLSRNAGRARITLQAGLRLELLHRGRTWASGVRDQALGPRLQLEVAPRPWFRVRAGVGRMTKVPNLTDLYPAPQYYDLVNFNYYANAPAERRAIVTTRILDRTNASLKMSRADKAEVGTELDFGNGGQLAVVAYQDRNRNAVGIDAATTFLIRERFAVDSATIGTGRPPGVIEPAFAKDTIPTLIDRPANSLDLRSTGLELTAIVPEIKALQTRLAVQGAWTKSRLYSNSVEFASGFSDFQLSQQIPRAPYWEALTRTGERLLVTTRLIHQQPKAGLIITGTLQYTLRERRQDVGSTDTLAFAGYITRAGVLVPVQLAQRSDPRYSDLRVARRGLVDPQIGAADWLFSLQVSKTLPYSGRLSFYAFNAFDKVGTYGSRNVAGRLYPATRFGLEVTVPVLGR